MLALRCDQIVLEHEIFDGYVIVDGEKIVDIVKEYSGENIKDYRGLVLMSGLVDSHVHINEPGRTEWEGFFTATQAALAGGITTVVDMPLNCDPVTTSLDALNIKKNALGEQLHVDVGFWGGVVPDNREELSLLAKGGVLGCKAFMVHSGIDDFPESDENVLREAMNVLKENNIPLLVHAEVDCGAEIHCHDETEYTHFLESRPQIWEVKAIEQVIRLSRETGCAVHVVHLSASEALEIIKKAKQEGVSITVETCPHYLCLTAEEIQKGQTQYKCAPPIRENTNREALWRGLKEGIIDFVVSDHSPCTPNLKKFETGNFTDAWGGISSLQLGLSSVWTVGQNFGISLQDLNNWLSLRPARFAGVSDRKGKIAKGHDADFVVWNPDESFVLEPQDLRFRHKMSPYLGRSLKGRVHYTYLRGRLCYAQGNIINSPIGKPIFHRASVKIAEQLNRQPEAERFQTLLRCCHSKSWVEKMISHHPFSSDKDVHQKAIEAWNQLEKEDFLEAFRGHPMIGANLDELRKKFQTTSSWSEGEQSGMQQASEDTILQLQKANQDYLSKFGYIFIVCATGKTADQMLEFINIRLHNAAEKELKIAAGEQQKITAIRLEKL